MLRLAASVEPEPPCDGVGALHIHAAGPVPDISALARRMGFGKAPFGRSREMSARVRVGGLLRRRASHFEVPGFGEVLTLGRIAGMSLDAQRRVATGNVRSPAPPRAAGMLSRLFPPPVIEGSVGEALNARGRIPVVAWDAASLLLAGSTPGAQAILDWVHHALEAGTLRLAERRDGLTLLAPGDPRLGQPQG